MFEALTLMLNDRLGEGHVFHGRCVDDMSGLTLRHSPLRSAMRRLHRAFDRLKLEIAPD